MESEELKKLLTAIERNTSATRSLAIFLLGSLPFILIALVVAAGAALLGATGEVLGIVWGSFLGLVAIVLVLFGSLNSIFRALKELRNSEIPKG